MNTTHLKLLALLALTSTPALAEESVREKAKATSKDVGREVKKAGHRVEEAVCLGTKLECERKKAGHRITEAKDSAVDKAEEVKDKVDGDGR